jgi:PAS domain S-box-containing protein
MKINIRSKLFILFFIILAITGGLGYCIYKSHNNLLNSERWIKHTNEVMIQAVNIRSLSKEIQMASRDFLITGDSSLLKPLDTLQNTVFIQIAQIRGLTRDNPSQQLRIDSLSFYLHGFFDYTLSTIKSRNVEGLSTILAYAADKKHKQYIGLINQTTTNISKAESNLLKLREQANLRDEIEFRQFSIPLLVLIIGCTTLLLTVSTKYLFQSDDKGKRAAELVIANTELSFQNDEKGKRAAELVVANTELSFQNNEKGKRAAELVIATSELSFQNDEKEKRAAELVIANTELSFQNDEKEKRAAELAIANTELSFQNDEKEKRAEELVIATSELSFQNDEKEKRAAELVVANAELSFQNDEKEKRAAELVIANAELSFQNDEKEKRAAELVIANAELSFQNDEKEKRAAELVIANAELSFQNEEKEKRAAELVIANAELSFQNDEKEKRAAELVIANAELSFQSDEKEKRAAELVIANADLLIQNEEKENRAKELYRIKNLYAFASQVNQDIAHVKDEKILFENACRIALEFGKFSIAWIGMFNLEKNTISSIHQIGLQNTAESNFKDVPLQANGPQENVLRTGNHYICNDILNEPGLANWRTLVLQQGICSCMLLPIKKSGEIIGTFNLYAAECDFYKGEEIALLTEVCNNISFAVDLFENEKKYKYAQHLIAQNENRFRSLIEKSADIITLTKIDGELLYVSASVTKWLGYAVRDLLHTSVFDIIHPDHLAAAIENKNKIALQAGSSFCYQQQRKHKNGTWVWCEGTLTNMLHEPGINAMVSNFRDISEKKRTEQQQEFDRNNLDALINNTDDLMWSVDTDFNLITSNQPFQTTLALNSGKSIAKGGDALLPALSAIEYNNYKLLYERAFSGESFTEIITNRYVTDGWSEISFCPIRAGDDVIGTACHSRDITQKIKVAQLLTRSEAFNRGVLNSLNSHIAVIDNIGNILAVNESWTRFAIENGETNMQGSSIGSNYLHVCERSGKNGDESAYEVFNGIIEVINEKRDIFYLEYPCHSPTEQRWFAMRAIKFEGDGQMVVVSHQNISQRKLAEQKLLSSELSLKEAQSIAHIGNFEIDINSHDETWSDEIYRILGLEDRPIKQGFSLSAFVHTDDLPFLRQDFGSFQNASRDYRMTRTDGATRYVNSEWKFEFNKAKKPTKLYGTLQDITDRKLAEMERIKMVNDLQLRNSELEQFAYVASHDLQEPLRMVTSFMTQLERKYGDIIDDKGKQYIHFAVDGAKRMREIILDLLDFSRVGKTEDELEDVDFNKLTTEILTLYRRQIEELQAVVTFENLPTVNTYKTPLRQVLQNLVGNSLKYHSAAKAPVINISCTETKTQFEFAVSDNGIGISSEYFDKIFIIFQRLHNKDEYSGTGMGLAIVKKIVENLGGKIWLTSEEGEGCTFYFTMPKIIVDGRSNYFLD